MGMPAIYSWRAGGGLSTWIKAGAGDAPSSNGPAAACPVGQPASPNLRHSDNDAGPRLAETAPMLSSGVNTMWVVVAAVLVMFMQAGFAFLEIGFSRQKNAGTVVAKILTNFSICAIVWWLCGFAFAFGNGKIIGDSGFLLRPYGDQDAYGIMAFSNASISAKFFFQFVFAAVSLAIVWGTTLERVKFGVYILYAIVFSAIIYPTAAHWVFGGGWLQDNGMQDFAGSTAVHLIGATGALAALLHLGPRRGKYTAD